MESGQAFKIPSTVSSYKEAIHDAYRRMIDHVNSRGKKYINIYCYINIAILYKSI